MMVCMRCREIKDDNRFRDGQPNHRIWCIRCERTPAGQLPYPQKDDVRLATMESDG